MPQTHLTDTRFDQFDLHPRILAGLEAAGFHYCTPIQAETLPLALAGQDIAGQAQTGTGKTAAFLVVALQRLLQFEMAAGMAPSVDQASGDDQPEPSAASNDEQDNAPRKPVQPPRQPRVLILAPTRELAVQIHKDAQLLAAKTRFRLGLVYGGTGYQAQRDKIAAGVDILIGTPGRLIDYLKQRVFDLRHVEVVVLDEADRMFDLGFIKDIRFVLRRLPAPSERLGMLFSATLSYRVMELAYEHMNDPKRVEITPERVTAERVTQRGYMVANDEKVPLLIGLLRQFEDARSMVFVNTKREGERVWGYLEGNGLKAAMLSGDVPQKKRLSLLRQFQEGELATMVATDVAARGLHIPGVTHVINYDLPDDAEDYVHRIGRTARAGAAGEAISFVCESYAMGWPDIEAFVGARIPISTVEPDLLAEVDSKSRVRVERRPRDGGRQSGRDGGRGSGAGARGGPRRERQGAAKPGPKPRSSATSTGDTADATAGARAPAPNGTAAPAGPNASASGTPKKRRRRRPRRPSAGQPEPTPQT
ncbi:DEAD/DEAH box helicase [Halochromatium salexigens]|uniref:ATP-dependent RNA helicase RhlB n=1 Tax=Halochromatium salexigens TaxID=49447 RepID=A0AAJ0XHI6_HALSE|nr:DEAD/DEAH box helicase [Halochromatium salexigens]MBK5931667.1 RNA helicase [Halochromatium salexigens]